MSTAETKPTELDRLFEQAMKIPPEQRLELRITPTEGESKSLVNLER